MRLLVTIWFVCGSAALSGAALTMSDLKLIYSDPNSLFAYAVCEADGSSEAILYEIDCLNERIVRELTVSSKVRGVAVQRSENRLYCSTWNGTDTTADVIIIDLALFEMLEVLEFPAPYNNSLPQNREVLSLSVGGTDRLVVGDSATFPLTLHNSTVNNPITGQEYGRVYSYDGELTSDGMLYYSGSSFGGIYKYDTSADSVSAISSIRPTEYISVGSNPVGRSKLVVSNDGSRIFWEGVMVDAELEQIGNTSERIYASSATGDVAFGYSTIYDFFKEEEIGLPVSTDVKDYNNVTQKLLYADGDGIYFYGYATNGIGSVPRNEAIIDTLSELDWPDVPSALHYQVYFGSSDLWESLGDAAMLMGITEQSNYTLVGSPPAGRYQWRVDVVTAAGTVVGEVSTLTVSPLLPGQPRVFAEVSYGDSSSTYSVSLDSNSEVSWVARSEDSWINISSVSGLSPGVIDIRFDASRLAPGEYESSIVFQHALTGDVLFELPISLTVWPIVPIQMSSDPESEYIYVISSPADSDESFILKVDSEHEEVIAVARFSSKISGHALSSFDQKLYVYDYESNQIHALSLLDLSIVETYESNWGSSLSGVRPAGAGYLILLGADVGNAHLALYSLEDNEVKSAAGFLEGVTVSLPGSEWVYRAESSGFYPSISRYQCTVDLLAPSPPPHGIWYSMDIPQYSNYDGYPLLVVSEDESRFFWNKLVVDSDAILEWDMGEIVKGCAHNGRYAFTDTTIYDVDSKLEVLGMPFNVDANAFNSTTSKLVVVAEGVLEFYPLPVPLALSAPSWRGINELPDGFQVEWNDVSLERGFEIQVRPSGSSSWEAVSHEIEQNETKTIISGLLEGTAYELRIRAVSEVVASAWSDIFSASTRPASVAAPVLNELDFSFDLYRLFPGAAGVWETTVYMNWSAVGGATNYQVERSVNDGSWQIVEILDANQLSYEKDRLPLITTYAYRVRAVLAHGFSSASATREFNFSSQRKEFGVPGRFMAETLSGEAIKLTWAGGLYESEYIVYRRVSGESLWGNRIATLPANVTEFIDTDLILGTRYEYRVVPSSFGSTEAYSTSAVSSLARDLGVEVDGDILTVDCILWGEAGSTGVLSMEVKTSNDTRSDTATVTYTSRFDVRFRYDLSSQEFLDFTFLDGVILHSDMSMEVIGSEITYSELGQRLATTLAWGTSGVVQQIETINASGAISTDGYLTADAHQIDTVDGRLYMTLSPEGYESVSDVSHFDQNPESEFLTGEARLVVESANASDALGGAFKVILTMEVSESSAEEIEETDAIIRLSEASVIVASTEIFVPSDFSLWAASSGVDLHSINQRNEAGIAYLMLYAFQQPVNSYNIPIEITTDATVSLNVALPDSGLRGTILPFYSETLDAGSWQPLPDECYIDGINSLNLGESGSVGLEFPQADQCFIRFEAQLP